MKTRRLLKVLRSIQYDRSLRKEIQQIAACQVAVILLRKRQATAKTRERKKLLRRKKSL